MASTLRFSEALLCAVLKISHSLYSKRVPVFVNKTLATVSDPNVEGSLHWGSPVAGWQRHVEALCIREHEEPRY